MEKTPIIITVDGGLVQNVDSPQALDVLVLDFDGGSDEELCCIKADNNPEDWPQVVQNAIKSLEKEGLDPGEYKTLNLSNEKPYSVTVAWSQEGAFTQTYSFETKAELSAFLYGCHEGDGWLDYNIIEKGD
ncbi:MAG: hypothetical protein JRJ39_00360 [Deltaproteobacteria bacterium]|nr:hypothetical protein [Deltaproteobacteria bacterium]MBW1845560.1 hypothetical protein [Deltaproteobacteria bacterium]MBW2031990.1 hypothetical protein [Deltaproteobacteria bacterium]